LNGEIYLGKLLGIPFRLHWSWFLAIFLISWSLASVLFPMTLPDWSDRPSAYWLLGLLSALGLFACVLLHELGHAVVARRFGVSVRGIRLFIFGGVAELGSDPKKPGHEILIAIGGPLVTLLLIVVFAGLLVLLHGSSDLSIDWESGLFPLPLHGSNPLALGLAGLAYYLCFVNVMLLVFNLIPAFPLDGGRVLRGIIWSVTGDYLRSTQAAAAIGIGFSYLLFIGGLFQAIGGNLVGGIWLFFLGMFLQNAANSSVAYAQFQHLLRGVRVRDVMCRQPLAIPADLDLRQAADDYFLRRPYKAYPVVRDDAFIGILTLRALQEIDRERWQTVRAGEAAQRAATLHPYEPVLQAMRKLGESGHSRLPVLEDGKLVGLLCRRDIMDFMEIRAGLAHGDRTGS
jgi:Zn-dependent protease/CBS domain-containing protein